MRALISLIGLGLILLGIYVLGQNIFFTTNPYPYWWRGIAADGSILALISGVLMLVFLPGESRNLGWILVVVGIVLVFLSSRAILSPTSLWQFLLSFGSISIGYQMITTGRTPF